MRSLLTFTTVLLLTWSTAPCQTPARYLRPEAVSALVQTLPAPPEVDSLAGQADLEAVLQVQAWRTPEQAAFAQKIDAWDVFDYSAVLGPWFRAPELPACAALFQAVEVDMFQGSSLAKKRFARLRPPYVDPRVKTCIEAPSRTSHSYPSGHSTALHLEALVLAEILPGQREALLVYADRAAWSRIIAGVHFPSDDVGGRRLAEALFAELEKNPEFLAAIARCRAEVAPFLLGKAG